MAFFLTTNERESGPFIRVHSRSFVVFLIHCNSYLGLDAITEAAN